ncbi:nucleotidyltransferase family protein [Amycolatopsis thermoflava]|uniref:hypothetical protein n=1 Tax=Amycolatopsis thermoflava TaxID=84480 RepID=UPI00364751B9
MVPTYKIAQSAIDLYATGPSQTRTSAVKNLHENIRSALNIWADNKFDTFLQGSYRNNTAIADINDVDIVALYDPWQSPVAASDWEKIFQRIAYILRETTLVSGAVSIGDKCIKFEGELKADIVPAVSIKPYSSTDPIMVFSRKEGRERENFPRQHYSNGVAKQDRSNDCYKATVRLFKRWVRQYPTLNAPSFYIECAVHSIPDARFDSYLPMSFLLTGAKILDYTRSTVIMSVAGDKDVLVPGEWHPSDFADFQDRLSGDLVRVSKAMEATSTAEANRLWRSAFGDI